MPSHPHDDPYAVPALYDLEYADHTEDLYHYLQLAQRLGGPVLEFACGTGRITLVLAESGVSVDAVDLSRPMLDALEKKVAERPQAVRERVRVFQADFRNYVPSQEYPLVLLPFNALHHTGGPEEVRAVFSAAHAALAPGGVFALDCYMVDRDLYERDPDQRYEERTYIDPRDGGRLESWEQSWWDEVARVHHVIYTYERVNGVQEKAHLKLRMYEAEELRVLLEETGFEILLEAQDFKGTPVTDKMLKWVVIARRRASRQ